MSDLSGWALPLARYLAHSLWQGGVILLGYLALLRGLRGAGPEVRHRVALTALVLLMLLPFLTALATAPAAPVVDHAPGAAAVSLATSLFRWTRGLAHLLTGRLSLLVVGAWLGGALLSLGRTMAGALRLGRLVVGARPVELAGIGGLAELAGLSRVPEVRESALVIAPCVVGWLRPVVLVPLGLEATLPPDQLRAVLLHEFAHLRRHDAATNLALRLLGALAWYQPLLRRLARDLEQERELCCDELAVRAIGRPVVLAQALVQLEERRQGQPRLVIAGTGGDLGRRIGRLLAGGAYPGRPATAQAALGLIGMVLLAGCSALLAGAAEADLAALARRAHALIQAEDPAGHFTVELVGERLVAATIAGQPIPAERIVQRGHRVRLLDASGSPALTLDVPGPGQIRWDPRPPPGS